MMPPRVSVGETHILPKLRYNTESKVGIGAALLRRFQFSDAGPETPTSSVRSRILGTTKGHVQARLRWNLFPASGRYAMRGRLEFNNTPYRFWGTGPDSHSDDQEIYQPQQMVAYVEFIRRSGPFQFGLRTEFEQVQYLQRESGGLLETQGYRGLDGNGIMGLGALLNWDTRDVAVFPTRGWLIQALFVGFPDDLGSKHSFNNQSLDLRNYQRLPGGSVLATQAFFMAVRGEAPIWRFASLGGRSHSRGYRSGRYLDRFLLAGQAEIRTPIWKRVGVVGFAGLANVAPTRRSLRLENLRPTVGTGLRLQLGKADRASARADIAVGESSARFYLSFGEAF
jgi:hypothetical protein